MRLLPILAALFAALLTALPSPVAGQAPGSGTVILGGASGEEVDGIVAVVGDSVILRSQLQERMLQLQAQGMDIPDDSVARDSLQHDLLESMVNDELLVQAAVRDTTIKVDSSRVDDIVTQDLQKRIQSFGSQQAMQQALRAQGMNMPTFREMLRADAQRQQLQNQYMAKRGNEAASIAVSDKEMRDFFAKNRERLGKRPATMTFKQVVIQPEASDTALARARSKAEELLDSLRNGADFQELAKRFSDDPGSKQQGGDLGWFRRGQMVPAFENAVFSLREGQVSGVVKTRFGFHIIKVERIRGAERRARHILITPTVTEDDVARARRRAEKLKEQIQAGASIDSLQDALGDQQLPDSTTVARDQLQKLPPGYEAALKNAREGEVLGPIQWGSTQQANLAIIQVEAVRDAGQFTFGDVKAQIRERLQQQKLMDRIFAELRERTPVEIRM